MPWSTTAGVKRMHMDVYKPVKCKSFGTVTLDAYIHCTKMQNKLDKLQTDLRLIK